MISGLFRNPEEDGKLLVKTFREKAAYAVDEQVTSVILRSREELIEFLSRDVLVDLIFIDVTLADGIGQAEMLRRSYPKAAIIVIADIRMSPVSYMKPTVLAAALLLKPLQPERIHQVLDEIFAQFIENSDEEEIFRIETREYTQRLPVSRILYFEAREKKVYACTANMEYGFYDTIDHLEQKMKDQFVRSHRSYLVNASLVEDVFLSKNYICLRGNIELPLSRSYKETFRKLKKEDGAI